MTSLTHSPPDIAPASPGGKILRVAREEVAGIGVRTWLMGCLPACLPAGAAGRLRAALYRQLGLSVGPGALIMGPMTLAGGAGSQTRVRIGAGCYVNRNVYLDTTAPVTLGDGVSVGHHVVIVTAGHAIGPPEFRAGAVQAAPVTVEDGAWLGAGVTLLPGVTVGRGAVVAAGAVVAKDVPPDTLVGGVPARWIRSLDTEE